MKTITTPHAPAAIGPYSQAIAHDGLLFVSGQLPLNAVNGQIEGSNAAEQAAVCLANIAAIAQAAKTSLSRTVKVTLLMTDLSEFSAVNAVYAQHFAAPYPARACYQVAALPRDAKIEIEAIIALEGKQG